MRLSLDISSENKIITWNYSIGKTWIQYDSIHGTLQTERPHDDVAHRAYHHRGHHRRRNTVLEEIGWLQVALTDVILNINSLKIGAECQGQSATVGK